MITVHEDTNAVEDEFAVHVQSNTMQTSNMFGQFAQALWSHRPVAKTGLNDCLLAEQLTAATCRQQSECLDPIGMVRAMTQSPARMFGAGGIAARAMLSGGWHVRCVPCFRLCESMVRQDAVRN